MLKLAALLFAAAALGGLTMAFIHFKKNRNPPAGLAILHGTLGASALVILLFYVVQTGMATPVLNWALILFVLAALGGFFLVSFHLRGKRLPSPVLVIHALVAVVAFLLLLSALLPAA
jgi:hypothetical protein